MIPVQAQIFWTWTRIGIICKSIGPYHALLFNNFSITGKSAISNQIFGLLTHPYSQFKLQIKPRMDLIRICQVCYTEAKSDSKHYSHYGAICCFGCKQFFRRLVNSAEVGNLICENNDQCDLHVKRTSCQKCRYQQCLKIGLDPRNVLVDEQERKKFSHPKKNKRLEEAQSGKVKSALMFSLIMYSLISSLCHQTPRLK